MYHKIYNDATLLHQKNDDIKKVYEKNRPILTVINVLRQCLQVKRIIMPILDHKTHDLFKYDKKVSLFFLK